MGLVNQLVKFNAKWLFAFETDYQRLFETNSNQANDDSQEAKSILTSTLHIFYQQVELDDNYGTYLEDVMISNNFLRTGIQRTQ